MKIPFNLNDGNKLLTFFRWSTRTGMGCYYGNTPISYYQMHQMNVYDILVEFARRLNCNDFYVRNGYLYCGSALISTTSAVYDEAQKMLRR